MTEIKTPNWRLSSVSPVSTGHTYQITDRRTDHVTYFDTVRVYDGMMSKVKLYREDETMDSGRSRAAIMRGIDDMPDVIIDGLKHLEEGGNLSDLGTRLDEQ